MQNMLMNLEAEQAVLGSILVEGDLLKEVSLEEKHFYDTKHKVIFKAMRDVDKSGKPVDVVTLVTELGNSITSVGGVSYLSDMANAVPSTENIKAYQGLILESYRLRETQKLAQEFMNNPSDEKIGRMYQSIGEIQELGVIKTRSKQDILVEIYQDMNEEKGELTGIDTGFKDLNRMTGGFQNGDLIIVAARPSVGKTAFALNLAKNNCKNGGVTDIFSLEMSDKQLVHRMLSAEAHINGGKWKNPKMYFTNEDYTKASNAMGVFDKWNLNILDEAKQTVADIRAAVRKTKRNNPGKKHLVIIDYLQLITIMGKFERNDLAVGSITRELKQMARTFDVPVVLLSQLSRAVEQRQDKRPMMSDLRDSGNIEQDADIVSFLYRDDYYDKESEQKNVIEIIIAKHRNGATGTIELGFVKEYGKFVNLERRFESESNGQKQSS